jgi:TonB-linked SusC/RagA family outer membrane protein
MKRFSTIISFAVLLSIFLTTVTFAQETISVTGKVTDASTGESLIGVTVQLKGATTGVSTNVNGAYSISVPANGTLVFTYLGYVKQEVAVNNLTVINVQLKASSELLEQVVVIGYGSANKRDLTGSIVKISAKEIADRPASNPLSLLQGKVAGLSVVNSGRPGEEPDVRIRGTNSINGVKPVYIVDGILSDNINFLNPSDIESIEVLKDPSSLAIFGVRGANGAIAVTTKKAKAGQLLVNFSSSVGFKNVNNRIKLTDAAQFKELYNEQLVNQEAPAYNYNLWNANTDWLDKILNEGVLYYNNISISGATDKNRFYMGIGYINEDGLINNEKYKKLTLNLSDELTVTKGLKFGLTFNAYRAELPGFPSDRNVGEALRAAPIAPIVDAGTGLYHTLPSFQRAQIPNPMLSIETEKNTALKREFRGVGSIYGDVDFLKNFNVRVQLFADYGFNTTRSYQPILAVYNPEIVGTDKRDSTRRSTRVDQGQNIFPKTQMDFLLNYKKKFGDHDLSVLGGVTTYYRAFEETSSSVLQGTSQEIPNNPDKWYVDNIGDPSTKRGSGSAWEDASLSYLGRILYNYQSKYLINASFRRDGSSQFYRLGNEWKNFGAVGLGWVISSEDFFANQNFLDYLKLKGSWGILGNKNIDERYRYPAFPTLTSANSGVFGNNVVAALERQYIPDPNLNWETVHLYEVGLELNTFKNSLHVETTYYNKVTKDVLTLIEGPSGTLPGLGNLGEISNKGFEFATDWNQDITKDLHISLSANLTTIKNKVNKLNKTGFSIFDGPARTTTGFPIGYFYGYVHDGIYQTNQEVLKSPSSTIGVVMPGDIKFKDLNGDGKITTDDRTMIGNPTPDFIYGGSVNLAYKGFDLGADLQGVFGNEIYRAWDQGTFADFNYLEGRTDRWNGIGTSNWEPILNTKRANNYQNSSYRIEDGSFFRIRNLQLGYTLGKNMLIRAKIKSFRIYINAQNLATFANNTGFTPEIGGTATQFGVDNGRYPVPTIYSAGFNLNF